MKGSTPRVLAPIVAGLVAISLAAGCSSGAATTTRELTIFAAASLRTALEAAIPIYEAGVPGSAVTLATDSSAALRTQIEQGAPADVFLSADVRDPIALAEAGLAAGQPRAFATNPLAVAIPADSPGDIDSVFDLAAPNVTIVAAGEDVPVTRYATELVAAIARSPGAPAGFAEAYARNIASREDNVAAVVAKLALGEGDAAVVYATDLVASDQVAAIPLPAGVEVVATYGGVALRDAPSPVAAQAFLDWLAGTAGQAVLSRFGFGPPHP